MLQGHRTKSGDLVMPSLHRSEVVRRCVVACLFRPNDSYKWDNKTAHEMVRVIDNAANA